jgi:hypothetical protein
MIRRGAVVGDDHLLAFLVISEVSEYHLALLGIEVTCGFRGR